MDVRGVGVRVPVGPIIVIALCRPDRLCGPPNLLSIGYRQIFLLKKKQLGREADHSPPTGAEVKKTWVYTPIPDKFSWRSAWIVKHRDNVTFLPYSSLSPVRKVATPFSRRASFMVISVCNSNTHFQASFTFSYVLIL
jgi:hypothetical protein